MYVIGHNNEMVKTITFSVMKKQCILNDFPDFSPFQNAFTVTLIKPSVHFHADFMVILLSRLIVPRLWMLRQPLFLESQKF